MANLKAEIQQLKQRLKAVILAHNYQLDEVQEVADYVGDSLYLSNIAAQVDGEVIVFCGVRFMAETAKILAPQKLVLLPESDAGCPLADTIGPADLERLKSRHPGVPVVCYVNSSVEIKAASDVCCTSANAVKVITSLPDDKVIFVPDENLGQYVAKQVPHKELILWPGCCVTHAKVKTADVMTARNKYPAAKILVHPECAPAVADLADFVGSTSAIIKYAEQSAAQTFIIGTEMGVLHKLKNLCPDKQFLLLHPGLLCPNMKKTTLASVQAALLNKQHEITVPEALARPAGQALRRMLELV